MYLIDNDISISNKTIAKHTTGALQAPTSYAKKYSYLHSSICVEGNQDFFEEEIEWKRSTVRM